MTTQDTLRRDDMVVSKTPIFDALTIEMQRAFKRAASRGIVNLPSDMGDGWLMVPVRGSVRQVVYRGLRAWVV